MVEVWRQEERSVRENRDRSLEIAWRLCQPGVSRGSFPALIIGACRAGFAIMEIDVMEVPVSIVPILSAA
jgi:hypothetical protein